ncbi:PLP-dependent aminotransferase family protein [Janthinobacterium psychrotolerans]|uniref:DNA-binding transcriptional regulator, MocR family n=1 Tax=Janthinobacterium psychrotolerans TaxID=1747903 RepID=A0A1A7C879_9BURK|nr:PLP-dependent aminotransferase family protein [Janthinobacterium psychrotolerans]OBV40980.1 DNA-binding transcriptional regulator, MocR family [Janthinobacterium psychrotolerans]
MNNTPAALLHLLARGAGETLIDQIVRSLAARIDDKLLRGGARMPSIRQCAASLQVSCATIVASYDKLVARDYLESRRGAGFYVRERAALHTPLPPATAAPGAPQPMDVVWLIRNMFRQAPGQAAPGSGMLPPEWLDGDLVARALRDVSRQSGASMISYGLPQGFLPLRQQLQIKLAGLEIACPPEQIVTTVGVMQALDLVAREFARPGDTIFVDDPAYWLMFGAFAAMGMQVIGIPRLKDGPDIAVLERLAAVHRPKLYVINSVLHNPSSTSLSAAKAYQVLRLAEQHDFLVVEDDIYCDMHPGAASTTQPATRLAALDQLRRVIYLGGFSKSLAANLRVGFIATSPERAQRLADRKMLATLTSSDIGERVVYKILSQGLYRKHAERLRARLDQVREPTYRRMERAGLRFEPAQAGMFVWADTGRDTSVLAEQALAEGLVLGPGSLFSPRQLPSTHMRLNLATVQEERVWDFFDRALGAEA